MSAMSPFGSTGFRNSTELTTNEEVLTIALQ